MQYLSLGPLIGIEYFLGTRASLHSQKPCQLERFRIFLRLFNHHMAGVRFGKGLATVTSTLLARCLQLSLCNI